MFLMPLALSLAAAPATSLPSGEPAAEERETIEELQRDNARLQAELQQADAEQTETSEKLDELSKDNEELAREQQRMREQAEQDRAELQDQIEQMRRDQQHTERRVDSLFEARLGGYADVGFFWVSGDGSGTRPDIAHASFPEFERRVNSAWVFMGDPLSTAINARGEPADTGSSKAISFDPVDAGSEPTFIVNTFNLFPHAVIGKQFAVDALIDFLPRPRDVARSDTPFLGDYVDIKRAQIRWIAPATRFDLDVFVGKIDSVFGREYRIQEAPVRTTVTPSLICRYTCGRPVGLSTRWKFLPSRALSLNASVTNGSTAQELYGFPGEIDTNAFKTVTSRVAYEFDVGAGLEVGMSGEVGAQDLQSADTRLHWQYGADLNLVIKGFELTAEFVQVRMQGRTTLGRPPCEDAVCLKALGAYGLAGYRITNWVMPYFRVDWRDAFQRSGASYVYIANLVRFTPGVRFDVGPHVAIKAEYTLNRELGRIPQFHNDVLTSSVVARF